METTLIFHDGHDLPHFAAFTLLAEEHELAQHVAQLRRAMPHLTVFGGCCGTDHRHVAALAAAVAR
jgi:methionine synthase I (cobalamin-dependent)